MDPAAVDTGPQRKKNESIRSVQPKCTKYRQEHVTYEAWSCANQHREWNLSYVCMNHSWMRPFLQPLRPDLRVTQHCCGTLLYVFATANVEHSLQILASLICLIYFIQLGYGRGPYCRRFESDFFQLLDVPNSRICFGPKTWTYTSWSVHTLCRYRNEKCVDSLSLCI